MQNKNKTNKISLKNILKICKEYNIIGSLITALFSLVAVIISIISLTRNNALLVPKFTLEFLPSSSSDSDDMNRNFKLFNCGGQILNPKLEIEMHLELEMVKTRNNVPYKECDFTINFTDFFTDDYFFNHSESAFTVVESRTNEIYDIMDYISSELNKKDIIIQDYSIKHYYKITYSDYKGRKRTKFYEPLNNYDFLLYDKEKRKRYVKDIDLLEMNKIDCANIEIPLTFGEHWKSIIINYDSTGKNYRNEMFDESKKINTSQYLSDFINENFNEYSTKLKTTVKRLPGNIVEKKTMKTKLSSENIVENNIIIGFKERRKEITILNVVLICIVILVSILFVICFFKKRNRTGKKNRKS